MTKYSYNYDEEAAEIERKMEEAKKPPVAHKERDVKEHSVLGCILLDFFVPFYSIYWMIRLNNDLRELANDYPSMAGWKIPLLYFATLGLFGFFWVMRQGKRVDKIKVANGDHFNRSSGLGYTLLLFFGFPWIAFAMMQSEINKNC